MKIKNLNLLAALLVCFASCSDDEAVDNTNLLPSEDGTTVVKFEMNANAGNNFSVVQRAINAPAITKDNFRIMAFKKSPADGRFLYAQDISTATMTYNNNVLSGTVRIPIGEYKFVSTYGLVNPSMFSLPTFTEQSTELKNDLSITHANLDNSSVFFLESGPLESLKPYQLGLNPTANENVTASLNRAVSRVDILFIQAVKNGDTYTEVSDSADVFGVSGLANIEMQFTGLNRDVNLVGKKISTGDASLFAENFTVPDLANTVTRGTSLEDTKVGTADFKSYDNITGDDIKQGSAHVHGAYMLPYDESRTTTTAQLVLTNKVGDVRTITVKDNIPLERNKVTLIKIYVLSGTVFNTDVDFNIAISTEWFDANTVEGEIK